MRSVRPRTLLVHGVIDASGFLFDPALISIAEARRRILPLLVPDARVYRIDGRLLLLLPRSRHLRTDFAPGLPLLRAGGILTPVPLTSNDIATLGASGNAVVLMRGGVATAEPLRDDLLELPEQWIDPGPLAPVEIVPLGLPPAPPMLLLDEMSFDARGGFVDIPEASDRLRRFVELLIVRSRFQLRRLRPGEPFIRGSTFTIIVAVIRQLLDLPPGSGPLIGIHVKERGASSAPGSAEVPLRWIEKLLSLPMFSRPRMGRQAKFIGEMLGMFHRGDFDEALRHAIPLGGPDTEMGRRLRSMFGGLSRRASLSLNLFGSVSSGGAGIPTTEGFFNGIESVYRKALATLELRGEIDKGAFIILELLNKPLEAVEFLERHGRFRQAAELAEGRKLDGAVVVRAWFLAGDVERAIRIARRTGAFAEAISNLNGNHPEEALRLRKLWAEMLARAGDYAGAIEVIWAEEKLHHLAIDWMVLVIGFGGISAARMLGRLLERDGEGTTPALRHALAILESEDSEGAGARLALAETLIRGRGNPVTRGVARAAVRALLRDAAAGISFPARKEFQRLVVFAGDGALKSDLPTFEVADAGTLLNRESPLELSFDAGDAGPIPVLDAAFLPGGFCAVALGEMGVRLLTRDGRTAAQFSQPAYQLIMADNGMRAIARAPRGGVERLARIDFEQRTSVFWRDATITCWAPNYDGALWFVANTEDLLAVDTLSDRFQAIWHNPDLGGEALLIARNEHHCSTIVHERWKLDAWGNRTEAEKKGWGRRSFQLPSLNLAGRVTISAGKGDLEEDRAISPSGFIATLHRDSSVDPASGGKREYLSMMIDGNRVAGSSVEAETYAPLAPLFGEIWLVAPMKSEHGVMVMLIDKRLATVRARISLGGATRVSIKLSVDHLTLADDRGRVIVIDLMSGHVTRMLRVV